MSSNKIKKMPANSYIRVYPSDLKALRKRLISEGFYDPWIAQRWKRKQVFGLAKELSLPLEWHIRGFRDGHLESEIEVSRRFIGHEFTPSKPFHNPLIKILHKYKVRFEYIKSPPPDPKEMIVPSTLIDWLPLAALFFNPVLRLCGAFKEEKQKTKFGNVEKQHQIDLRGLMFAVLILSVPLRIIGTILLMIPMRIRQQIFLKLHRFASVRPAVRDLVSIYSTSTSKVKEDHKILFQKFFNNLKLEKLTQLQLSTSCLKVNVE